MAYIGQEPLVEFSSIPTKDSFTGDGSTVAFDMSAAVVSAADNALEVFVDNVRQEPGSGKAYTVGLDGSNDNKRITFSAAPANGAAIYVINDKSNTTTLVTPTNLGGVELILDADNDTSITADTDDQIDFKIGSADHLKILSSSGDTVFKPMVDAKDIVFQQFDGNKIFCIDDGNFVSVGGNSAAPGEIRIYEDTDLGANYTGFKAGNLTASVAYQLPLADGSSGQALATDGSGVLSWTTIATNTPTSADGQALGSASLEWSDLFLADGAVINFGADQDINLTHVHNTGLTTNADFTVGDDLFVSGGLIDLKNTGTVSTIKFYCESSNAHAQSLVAAPHAQGATNTLTLPDGNDGVLVSTVSTATLTNKTLTSPVINTGTFGTSILPVSADGTTLGSASKEFSDLFLADSSTIQFGNDQDTTLTHTDGAGLTLNSTNKLMFNDASQFIQGASATVLDIAGGDEIELTATLINVQGNLAVSGTTAQTGVLTANAGIVVDNITIDGTEIDLSSGDLTIDVAGDINLDAGGNDIFFKSGGTNFGQITNSSSDLVIRPTTQDKDFIVKGNDGGAAITALTLDMSAAGAATFNDKITAVGTSVFTNLDISGDVDVDGTTNLDVVDIDGALTQDGGAVFNEASADVDFRIESNGNDHMFFVDAGNNHINIGTSSDLGGNLNVNGHIVSSRDDNGDNLTLISTDADASSGPNLRLYRNSHTGSHNPQDGDTLGVVEFEGQNDAGQDVIYSQIRTILNDASDGTEDGQLDIKIMNGGALNLTASFKGTETVINDASIDHDFRVESNGNTHMLFVDGGANKVGIGETSVADLDATLHVKTSDSGGTFHAEGDELGVESSGNSGISILSGSSSLGSLYFGDSEDNNSGRVVYSHSTNRFDFTINAGEIFRMASTHTGPQGGKFSTFGEDAPDCGDGGITAQQGSNDDNLLTMKSSDVAHGMTNSAETDTFAIFKKNDNTTGGLDILTFTERTDGEAIRIIAAATGLNADKATNATAAISLVAALKNGSGIGGCDSDDNLLSISNGVNQQFLFDNEGTMHSNAGVVTYDTYEDAHLVRAMDLSTSTKGLIASKFDEFIQYNHEDLAAAKIVGRDKDGTPNSMINWMAMSQLHNGAIWQQYEKTQRLTQAMYKLATKTLGKEEADKLLDEEEIKLLN